MHPVGLLLALTLAQSTPNEFDLLCTGESLLGAIGEDESTYRRYPLENRIRVSLTERKFCWNDCEQVYSLVAVDDEFITFNHDRDDIAPQRVNRRTGVFSGDGIIGTLRSIDRATCHRVAFSGLPARQF